MDREMEHAVFGDSGVLCVAFGPQNGHTYDFRNFGMIDTIAPWIDAGKLRQLFPPEQFAVEFTSPEPVLALVDYSALGQAGYFRYHSAILEDGEEDNQVVNE